MTKLNKKERNKKTVRRMHVQSQGSTMGKKNKKDKDKPIKTTHIPRMTDGKTNVNTENLNEIGNIMCFCANADQLLNKQN